GDGDTEQRAAGDEGDARADTAGERTREGAGRDPDDVSEIEQGDHAHRKVERRAGQVERDVIEHRGKDEEGEKTYGEHAQELLPREQREKSRRFGARSGSRGLARQPAQRGYDDAADQCPGGD